MDTVLTHITALDVVRRLRQPSLFAQAPHVPTSLPHVAPSAADLSEARERCAPLQELGPALHVVVSQDAGRRITPETEQHVCTAELPPGALIQMLPGLRCASPLLIPVQLAPLLTKNELVMLLAELLGTYAIAPEESNGLIQRPRALITPDQLRAFLDALGPLPGTALVRSALAEAPANAASPMEGKLFLRTVRRFASGGYRFGSVALNDSVVLEALSAEVPELRVRKPDLLLLAPPPRERILMPFRGVAFDYYGRGHESPEQIRRDAERANELLAAGFKDYVLWKEHYDSISYMDSIMGCARQDLGLPKRKLTEARAKMELQARVRLWAELERIDGTHWSFLSEKDEWAFSWCENPRL